jgi:cysteine-rich repeat protein
MRTLVRVLGAPAGGVALVTSLAASACGDSEGRPSSLPFATGGTAGGGSSTGGTAMLGGETGAGSGTGGLAAQGGRGGDPAACGNGSVEAGETCDDGNLEPDDGCSANCRVDPGWICELAQPCRPLVVDSSCTDACWAGDACIERDSGVTCECPEEQPDACGELAFRSLVQPEGWSSCRAQAVSRDGMTVVGACTRTDQNNQELLTVPVAWEPGTGVRVVDDAAEGGVLNAVSADGAVFVGIDGQGRALRFGDGEPDVVAEAGVATAISADGSVVVGFAENQAFRWSSAGGLAPLEGPDGQMESYALGVNSDGTLVVGMVRDMARARAVRWNAEGEAEFLPVPDDTTDSEAGASSDDGSVIVGTLWFDGETQAVRWTDAGFELLSGSAPSSARAVSADGSRIVGSADYEPGTWDDGGEFRALRDALSSEGLEDWAFDGLSGASSDGSVVVGTAQYLGVGQLSYESRAFLAVLR